MNVNEFRYSEGYGTSLPPVFRGCRPSATRGARAVLVGAWEAPALHRDGDIFLPRPFALDLGNIIGGTLAIRPLQP